MRNYDELINLVVREMIKSQSYEESEGIIERLQNEEWDESLLEELSEELLNIKI